MKIFQKTHKTDIQTCYSLPVPLYYNPRQQMAAAGFQQQLSLLKKQLNNDKKTPVFLCIGSDRATGDCFGPLVGETLSHTFCHTPQRVAVFGTLKTPVHAMNLEHTIRHIHSTYDNPFIIALDACLGIPGHIGYISLANGPLLPGIGVKKNLPGVGDIAITGIVNQSGNGCHAILQTTRLSTVVELSDFVSSGILSVYGTP